MKRNIIAASAALFALAACSNAPKTETIDLFNGTDLTGWEFVVADDAVPASQVFSAVGGEIHITGEPFGYMYYAAEKFSNYTLEAEWSWFDEPKNSGIFLLIAETSNPFPNGIECQLMAGNAGDFVLLGGSDMEEYVAPEGEGRPKFPKIIKKEASSEKPVGEWNHARIEVNDGHITVYINGVLQNEGTDPVKEGYVALQSEGGPIKFRNVRITR